MSGTSSVGRYWITLGKEIIWDVPKDFPEECAKGTYNPVASEISNVIKSYLNTSRKDLLSKDFPDDRWGITNIMLAADRRLGRNSLQALSKRNLADPARRILEIRSPKVSTI